MRKSSSPCYSSVSRVVDTERRRKTPRLIKSPHDKQSYRVIKLDNGLKATLVSTAAIHSEFDDCSGSTRGDAKMSESEMFGVSAAALTVRCGTFQDPPDMPGTAHLVEHMLLLGSEKYPTENGLLKLVLSHNGFLNAQTTHEFTSFYFDIAELALSKALDRLAHIFINPLFDESAIKREVRALDSEFRLRESVDAFRQVELLSHLAGPDHPMGRFRWGSAQTLLEEPSRRGVDVRAALLNFFNSYYSADLMTLCVLSKRSIDEIEQLVRRSFSAIPRRQTRPLSYPATLPFAANENNFNKLIKVVPVSSMARAITFSWVLPPQRNHYTEKSLEYLAYVVGHEGRRGIFDHLRERNWALRLMAGVEVDSFKDNSACAIFSIDIALTDEGTRQVAAVTRLVHQYLHLLRKTRPQKSFWSELKYMAGYNFLYDEWCQPRELVGCVSFAMQIFAEEHYLNGSRFYGSFAPDSIRALLDLMTPDRCNTLLMCCDFRDNVDSFPLREPRMGTRYRIEDFPEHWRNLWNDDPAFQTNLALPERNPFIPTDFSIRCEPQIAAGNKVPKLVTQQRCGRLWYLGRFGLPKCIVSLRFVSEQQPSVKDTICTELINMMIGRSLQHTGFYADMASLRVTFGSHVTIAGFSHKLPQLAATVLDRYLGSEFITVELFELAKLIIGMEHRSRLCSNQGYADDLLALITDPSHTTLLERDECLAELTPEDVIRRAQSLRSDSTIDVYVHGNMTTRQARKLFACMVSKLQSQHGSNVKTSQMSPVATRATAMPPHCLTAGSAAVANHREAYVRVLSFNSADKCSRIVNFYALAPSSDAVARFSALLLVMLMRERSVSFLRTQLQLTYEVFCRVEHFGETVGIAIFASPPAADFSLTYVDGKIDELVSGMAAHFGQLDDEEFEAAKSSLIRGNQATLSMEGEQRNNWQEITAQQCDFVGNTSTTTTTTTTTYSDDFQAESALSCNRFRQWCSEVLSESNRAARTTKISIQVVGYGKLALDDCADGEAIWKEFAQLDSSEPKSRVPIGKQLPKPKFLVPKNIGDRHFITDLKTLTRFSRSTH